MFLVKGRHCVLTLAPSDLSSNLRISSLHPIILAMEPHHKTIKLKASGGRIPSGFPQDQLGPSTVQNIRERIRSVRPYVTGEESSWEHGALTRGMGDLFYL